MNEFLRSILDGINMVVNNYGVSIILFTLLIRLILFPLDYKSRKGMRKTQLLQPQLNALQKKYANDKEKLNQKMAELYRKEKINPLSSCLPLLISMPVLFAMFAAMRMIANEELANQVFTILQGQRPAFEGFLWIKNIWMPDSPFSAVMPDANSIAMIPQDIWQTVYQNLGDLKNSLPALMNTAGEIIPYDFSSAETVKATVAAMTAQMQSMQVYKDALAVVPGWGNVSILIASITVYMHGNGFFILPLLACGTQLLMTLTTPQPQAQEGQKQPGGAFMKWFFPIFSLWICAGYNAGFSVYWVAANIIAAVQNYGLNWYFDAQDKKKAISGEGAVK